MNGCFSARFVASALVLVVLLTACGGADLGSPPSTASGDGDVPVDEGACPNLLGSIDEQAEMGAATSDSVFIDAQARFAPDADVLRAYGEAHPDEYVGIRFVRTPRPGYAISFVDHLVEHCTALRASVAYPEEFWVVRQAVSSSELAQIRAEIEALAGDRPGFVIGEGFGTLGVGLGVGDEDLAAVITERYGDVIDELTVGFFPYPDIRSAGVDECEGLIASEVHDAGPIAVTLALEAGTVTSGDDFSGVVTLHNQGAVATTISSGDPLLVVLFEPGGSMPVAGYAGVVLGVGLETTLEPGASRQVSALGGTASCDPDIGYALPPGRYEARAVIEELGDDYDPTSPTAFLSEPEPIEVTP